MPARTYRAASLTAALGAVRESLGSDAVIVSVSESESGAEVVAAVSPSRKGTRKLFEKTRAWRSGRSAAMAVGAEMVGAAEPVSLGSEEFVPPKEPLRAPVRSPAARAGLQGGASLRVVGAPIPSSPIATALEAMDLPPDLAARIASVAGRGPLGWERVLAWLESGWPVPGPTVARHGRPQAFAFVGPEGVGRSTLIRGIASRAVIDEPGRVVMLQVGFPGRPVNPLAEHAAPVGVEVRRANHPGELRDVVFDHQDVSAVLLDLPSVDVHDAGERRALFRFVESARRACPEIGWHAVLSARWSARESVRALDALDLIPLAGVAWTFLDRVADPGTLLATTLRTDIPPSFLHGGRSGTGEHSGAASWDSVVDWLSSASSPKAAGA